MEERQAKTVPDSAVCPGELSLQVTWWEDMTRTTSGGDYKTQLEPSPWEMACRQFPGVWVGFVLIRVACSQGPCGGQKAARGLAL